MFIETGDQYRQSLVGRNLEIYAGGERISEVTTHPLTSPGVGMWMVESLHGGGSPEAEKIAIRAHYLLDHAKGLVQALARLTSG